jgi:tetratricopeptide (TPR) repeat protein
MAPGTPWADRYRILEDLLREARPRREDQYFGVLVDIDALDPGPLGLEESWDDRAFGWQRRMFLEMLAAASKRGGWIVLRPEPSKAVALPPAEPSGPTALFVPEIHPIVEKLSSDGRPILTWLIESGTLTARNVERRFEASDGDAKRLERHLIAVVYDALSEQAAEAAERLSILRPPQPLNGALGPYPIRTARVDGASPRASAEQFSLSRDILDELRACGFLQPWPGRDGHPALRMPRSVRVYLEQQAMASMALELGAEHRRLASIELGRGDIDAEIEAHHHATRVHPANAEDIQRAVDTARYYVADLREMGVRLSTVEHRYADAADVFQQIVERDPTDAYAWEYLGYNLARSYQDAPVPDEGRERIIQAYKNAIGHDRDSDNPLYHGRLLGFRARVDEDIRGEFDQKMHRYLASANATSAVRYFAEAVLNGMPRGPQRTAMINRWRPQLSRDKRLQRFLADA